MGTPLPQAEKNLVISFVHYLRSKVAAGTVTAEQQEGLEVAIQCMESAFDFSEADYSFHPSRPLVEIFTEAEGATPAPVKTEAVSEQDREKAERLKNEGNELMREAKFEEASAKYSEAINIHSNAIFYCNRAAAYSKLEKHDLAIQDCRSALSIDPKYSKAFGRMGMALSCQSRYREAADAYKKALEIEPANESFKNNLAVVEEKLRETGGFGAANMGGLGAGNPFGAMGGGGPGGFDIGSMLNNPAMMNMASQIMSDPNMQNMMANLVGGAMGEEGGAQGLEGLMRAGQQLAQQMTTQNPDLVNQLRQNYGGPPDGSNPPHGSNPPDGSNPPGNPPPGDGGSSGGGSGGSGAGPAN